MKKNEIIHQAKVASDLAAIEHLANSLQKTVGFIHEITGKTPSLEGILEVYQTAINKRDAFFELTNLTGTGSNKIQARFSDAEKEKILLFGCHLPALNLGSKYLTSQTFILENGKVKIDPSVKYRVEQANSVKLSNQTLKSVEWVEAFVKLYNSRPSDVSFLANRVGLPFLCKVVSKNNQSEIALDLDKICEHELNYQKHN